MKRRNQSTTDRTFGASPGRAPFGPFLRRRCGSILVETAFVVPILLLIIMGTVEVGRYVLLEQKIARLAANIADLTARSTRLTEDEIDQVFNAASFVVAPFELGDQGTVLLSNVGRPRGQSESNVNWQRRGPGTGSDVSQIGTEGGRATLPARMEVLEGEDVIVAEVYYEYRPLVFADIVNAGTLYRTSFARPRFGALTTID
jgi:Flp pilus assembly protein TadG